MQFGTLRIAVKAIGDQTDGNGEFEGILSTTATDREGESVAAGAFNPLPKSIPLYHAHDWMTGAPPIGRATPTYEDGAVKVKGYFASTPEAQKIRTLVNEGVIDSMSAGFLYGAKKALGNGRSEVTSGELFEGSLTAIPVNREASISGSKSLTVERDGEAITGLKAGARNNASDAGRLQSIHDLAVENGASCSASKSLTARTVALKSVAGSYEARAEDIMEALRERCEETGEAFGTSGDYYPINVIATFDDRVAYRIGWNFDDDEGWQVPYTWDGETVTLGTPEPINVSQVITPATEPDDTAIGTTSLKPKADEPSHDLTTTSSDDATAAPADAGAAAAKSLSDGDAEGLAELKATWALRGHAQTFAA